MTSINDWIKSELDRTGATQRELARAIGMETDVLNKILSAPPGKKRRKVSADEHLAIEAYFKRRAAKDAPTVESVASISAKRSLADTSQGRVRSASGAPDLVGPKNLNVLGFVKAGRLGFYPDNGETLEMTERPPMLLGVPGAYAVYIDDRSMAPALKPGHLLWVHPKKPARPDDYVIIQQNDGQAFVKEYVRKTDKHIICRQYNPEGEVRFPVDSEIHLVVGIRTSG